MKILFCGTMVPEIIEYEEKQISAAGNRFQNNLIKNMRKLGHEVFVLSYVAIPLSGNQKKIMKNTENQKYVFRDKKDYAGTKKAVRECKEAAGDMLRAADVVMCYNVFYSFMFVPKMARKWKRKNILILADYSSPESFRNIKNKVYAKLQKKVIRQYHTVVGLSANIQKALTKKQNFILMRGGIDEDFYERFSYKEKIENKAVIFLYSGLLSEVTGVNLLLEAIKKTEEPDVRFVFTGKGELEKEVKEAAETDRRIAYKGHLTYEGYINELQDADVLVNPRDMSLPENQNNFPSKIMDYLVTGKPVLSTRFCGWEDFQKNICFCDAAADDIAMKLKSICIFLRNKNEESSKEELAEKKKRKEYFEYNRNVAKKYLWTEQLKKILS